MAEATQPETPIAVKACQSCGSEYGQRWGLKQFLASRVCSRPCARKLARRSYPTREECFFSKVDKTLGFGPNGDCWLWTGYRQEAGYGRFRVGTVTRPAHVVSYQMHKGPMPPGSFGLHTCDMPSCVNPDHIVAGTHTENMRDMIAKGRQRFSNRGGTKLTPDAVRAIRKDERSIKALALAYGVSRAHVRSIKDRRCWASVE